MSDPRPAIPPQPGILDIAPYVGGENSALGANRTVKLSANENPYGPSPKAIEAFQALSGTLGLYPDGGSEGLRQAIGEVHGLDPARIVCGSGSDELISLLCQGYAGPGDEVLYCQHGFLMFAISARANGATPVAAPETNLTADVDALLAAITDRTRLIFVANPNNPTGTMIPSSELRRLADAVPPSAILVVDAAYAEYVDDPDYDAGDRLAAERDNVVMTRTFSKIHGLAALRLGWAYAPAHVADVLERIRGPFNVNAAAQAAGEAAIRDVGYVAECASRNAAWRDWLAARLTAAGVPCTPSAGNFILAEFGEDGPAGADAADAWLKQRGLVVRRVGGYGLPGHLRISIGDEQACRDVAEAVAAFRAENA